LFFSKQKAWFARLLCQCWDSVPEKRPTFESAVAALLDSTAAEGVEVVLPSLPAANSLAPPLPLKPTQKRAEILSNVRMSALNPAFAALSRSLEQYPAALPASPAPLCRVTRRVVLPATATALAVSGSGTGELLWAALHDGSVACVSVRAGAVLNVLPLREVPTTAIAKVWSCFFGF
jgi:hypothetical protein